MTPSARPQSRRLLQWIIEHNPTYLISACLTAAGTRALLVGPSAATGDLGLILTTLCLLQVYEWAVATILYALQRARRSPEDRPSLLLVATVFWTGPIAATIELMALDPDLGISLAAGVCVIAIGELRLACKALGLRLAPAAQIIGAACMVLLAGTARLLKIPDANNGLNELFLYAAWWAFAVIVLAVVAVVRRHCPDTPACADEAISASASSTRQDFLFIAITLTAVAIHLLGMNYGFFCHARPFYAAPVIIAVAMVGLAAIKPLAPWSRLAATAFGLLPVAAMVLARQGFDSSVPIERLPLWLRDPLIAAFIFASAAWWYGFRRHHATLLLHTAFAAMVFVVLRVVPESLVAPVAVRYAIGPTVLFSAAAWLAVISLLLRSRLNAVAAIATNLTAVAWLVIGRSPFADLIVCLAAGWSAWLAVHLLARRPHLFWRFIPVIYLAAAPWMLHQAPLYRELIAANAIMLVNVLLVAGTIYPWTRYRALALFVIAGYAVGAAIMGTAKGPRPAAGLLLIGGFATLAAGALISWFKHQLVVAIADEKTAVPEPPAN